LTGNGAMAKSLSLSKMPFDQYGRYLKVSEIIKELAVYKKQKKYSILDVGGYNGSLDRFFDADQAAITVLDVYDSDEPNYIKGTALKLPFNNDSYDYVVSFEVFEHIPRTDREKFIQESLRVSRGPILLTAPFSGKEDEVLESEILVNSLWKSIHKRDHQWLHEHIAYKTPKLEELESIFKKLNVPFKRVGNNELTLWNLMQSLTFLTTIFRDSGRNDSVQSFYNENIEALESASDYYYRYIFLAGGESKIDLKSMWSGKSKPDRKKIFELIGRMFKSLSSDIQSIITENQELMTQNEALRGQNKEFQIELESIKSSRSWKLAQSIAKTNRSLRFKK
jgi:hypothetical protein